MRKGKLFFAVLAALLAVAMVPPAQAQTSKGAIAGTISDSTGALVPNATVKASSSEVGGAERSTTTDSAGAYRIDALLPGTYQVVVTMAGFSELKISGVEVRAAVTVTVNGTLEVSAQVATVTVEAGAGQELQTQSGEISGSITRKEISELPINGLNPIALVLTLPGVIQPASRDDFTNGVGFSVNGTRPRGNNFLLDSQSNNDLSISGQAFQPQNLEAVGEVIILTNSYSAQFGKGGGSVTNVVYKGGTNEFHGSAWDLIRNSALEAIPANLKPPGGNETRNPVFVQNTFGFSFGGPAIRNKLFFFGSSQWDRFRSTATDSRLRVPTEAGITTLQALGANPRVATLISALGGLRGSSDASIPGNVVNIALGNGRPAVETGFVTPSGLAQLSNSYEWSVRGDWLPSANDTITARYLASRQTFSPDTFANPGQLPGFRTQQGGPSNNLGTSWVHTFSGRALNEFRFAYSFIDFTFGLTPETAANPTSAGPTSFINGNGFLSGTGLGVNSAFPQGRNHQVFQIQDVATVTMGQHTFRYGFDLAFYNAEQAVPFNSRGTINHNPGGDCNPDPVLVTACTALANFVDDFSGSAGGVAKVFGSPIARPNQIIQAYYVEDTWRVLTNLTLTLGVRYEYFGTPENVLDFPAIRPELGQFTDPFPTVIKQKRDLNNWAPRVGFAYTPRFWPRLFGQDKTVIRAGYGLFYDGIFNNILVNSAASAPNVIGGALTAPSSTVSRGFANNSALVGTISPSALSPLLSVTSVSSELVSPLTHQWNLNIQRELSWNFLVTAAYVGTSGVRLFGNDEFNFRVNGVRINPARGAVLARTNGRHSSYHSAQLTVDRRFSRGLLFRGSYTFSRNIDNGSEVFTTSGGSSRVQDFSNPDGDKGLSVFHRAHRLALTYVYDIPTFKPSDNVGVKILRGITRDWQISGTTSFQTGAPETIFIGGIDTNADGNAFNGRPNRGNPSAPFTSVGIDGTLFGVPTPSGQYFEVQNFFSCDDVTIICLAAQPASDFRFLVESGIGNVGRNTVTANGRQDWNFGILRRIKLPLGRLENQELEFRAEFFNVFNHPNQGIPSMDVLDPDFGNNALTRFGGRSIRFWLKWKF